MKPTLFVSGLFIFSFLVIETPAEAAEMDAGKEPYIQYCGSCHGEDGRGGGPISAYLKIKVPDLTLRKKNNKEIYHMGNVMSASGSATSIDMVRASINNKTCEFKDNSTILEA